MCFALLLGWWLVAGAIFLAKPTNDRAKLALSFVILIIAIDVVMHGWRPRNAQTGG